MPSLLTTRATNTKHPSAATPTSVSLSSPVPTPHPISPPHQRWVVDEGLFHGAQIWTSGNTKYGIAVAIEYILQNFKDRAEFNSNRGSMYNESIRPDSPSTLWGDNGRGRPSSRGSNRVGDEPGVTYPTGYHQTPSALREYSPSPEPRLRQMESNSSQPYQVHDQHNLLSGAAPMGQQGPGAYTPYSPERDGEGKIDYFRK